MIFNNKTRLSALILCLFMVLSLFSCVGENDETQAPTDEVPTEATNEETTNESTEETTAGMTEDTVNETSEEETDTDEVTIEDNSVSEEITAEETTTEETTSEEITGDYSNATGITDAGAKLGEGDFALSVNNIDESKAINKTAAEMLALLAKKDGTSAGEVYRVTEPLTLSSDKKYDGNLSAIIAEGGIVIKNISGTTLRELIIKGSITVENSSEINLYKVDLGGTGTGIIIDENSSDISVLSSIVNATETAIHSNGAVTSVYQSKLTGKNGIISNGTDFAVQSTFIDAEISGIRSSGSYFIAKNNTITVSDTKNGIGIEMTNGSYNSMAALNVINDVQRSISVTDGYNCVIEVNRAITITGSNNKHLYVIKNRLGGELELKNNNYMIADGNTFIKDNRYHPVILEANSNFNGDNMHDINARLEYGADEDLLPHTDLDQFTNMEIRTKITDLSSAQTQNYSSYIKDAATWNKIVIIPPGLYTTSVTTLLEDKQSDTDVYAYGSKLMLTRTWGDYNLFKVDNAENINVNGFTGGIDRPSCGQIYIVGVDAANRKLTAIVGAGFVEGFHDLQPSDPEDCGYNDGSGYVTTYHQKDGELINYGGRGNVQHVVDNGDGTITVTMSSVEGCGRIEIGDVFVTRLGYRGQNAIYNSFSSNIKYKDLTVYNISNSTACRVVDLCRDVSFERYHSAKTRGYEISKETYDKYKAYETKYGVDLGVYYDEEYGIYRGPDPIWASSSCMEVGQSYTGTKVVSSLIHSTCDDASNQRGMSSRIAGMVNNGDGTYTVYYKGNLTTKAIENFTDTTKDSTHLVQSEAESLDVGNTIVAYTADGHVLIDDAIVLTAPKKGSPADVHIAHTGTGQNCDECGIKVRDGYAYQELSNTYDPETGALTFNVYSSTSKRAQVTWTTTVRSVTIDAKYVNEELLDSYDFCSNTDQHEKRVTLDNVSKNSAGVYFDNVYIEDTLSVRAKTKDVVIKNCTFKNTSPLLLGAEAEWGEATVSRNVIVENNLFDGTANVNEYSKQSGWYDNHPDVTPINIRGIGTTDVSMISNITPHENMLASNIVIRHNKFINSDCNHLISVTGACDVTITDNVFEEREGDGEIVYINGCYNVNVIGNKYSERIQAAFEKGNYNPIADIFNCEHVTIEDLKIPDKVTLKPTK